MCLCVCAKQKIGVDQRSRLGEKKKPTSRQNEAFICREIESNRSAEFGLFSFGLVKLKAMRYYVRYQVGYNCVCVCASMQSKLFALNHRARRRMSANGTVCERRDK